MFSSVVVGGARGLGRVIAQRMADRGEDVVISGRDGARARAVAAEIGQGVRGIALDLASPETIGAALSDVRAVDRLVITAIEQAANSVSAFDVAEATRSVTVKLVGYIEVVRVLHPRLAPGASVVLFGGLAKDRLYPGSTIVTTFNGEGERDDQDARV